MTMPDLEKRDLEQQEFPFQFKCKCGADVEVTREDVADLAEHAWSTSQAVNHMLVAKYGWWDTVGGKICPDCLHGDD